MIVNVEATVLGDLLLPLLDFRIVEFLHAPALHANEVVVMAALVQFKDRLATLKVVPHQQSGLLELCQHTVNRCQADFCVFGQQQFVYVLCRQMPLRGVLKQVQHLQPGEGGVEAHVSQFFGFGHDDLAREALIISCFVRLLSGVLHPSGTPLAQVQQDRVGYNAKSSCLESFTMRVTRFPFLVVVAVVPLLVAGCAGFGVHRIDIQQGNLVTEAQVAKVKPGMSKLDVRNALGTPLLQDVFNGNRWDYVFSLDQSTKYGPFGRDKQEYKVTIRFENDKVAKVEGKASTIEILTGGGEKRQLPNTLPPGAPPPKQ